MLASVLGQTLTWWATSKKEEQNQNWFVLVYAISRRNSIPMPFCLCNIEIHNEKEIGTFEDRNKRGVFPLFGSEHLRLMESLSGHSFSRSICQSEWKGIELTDSCLFKHSPVRIIVSVHTMEQQSGRRLTAWLIFCFSFLEGKTATDHNTSVFYHLNSLRGSLWWFVVPKQTELQLIHLFTSHVNSVCVGKLW